MGIYSFSPFGYEGSIVNVEVDVRRGIPAVDIVGIADSAVREVCGRVKSAIANSGFEFPAERVLINLSPVDLKKEGSYFDLAIALGILSNTDKNVFVMGELELSGNVRPVCAVSAGMNTAVNYGINFAIVPKGCGVNVPGMTVYEVETLKDAVTVLGKLGESDIEVFEFKEKEFDDKIVDVDGVLFPSEVNDIGMVNGKALGALIIAAAGHHNFLFYGAFGCGKTMLAQALPQITPCLSFEESKSTNRIHNIAGLSRQSMIRPFRRPHHTASIEGMCGGGVFCRPGEISLAHNGTLFLDEAAEFRSSVLQMLRVPLESHSITLSRAGRTTVYPAHFQLGLITNPCPCGNFGSEEKLCLCSAKAVEMYWRKFSAPLLDRVPIRVDFDSEKNAIPNWEYIRKNIAGAYKRQMARFGKFNADLTPEELANVFSGCEVKDYINEIAEKREFSPRMLSNFMKLILTHADVYTNGEITIVSVEEANNLIGELPL